MKVIYGGKEIADVPDCLTSGDTIIVKNSIYEIQTKTYDSDLSDLYCKVIIYDEKVSTCEMMSRIYQSPYFKTSGLSTNNINDNPRILVLTILMPILIEEAHLMKMAGSYRKNVTRRWGDVNVNWNDIFMDDPPAINTNMNKIASLASSLFKSAKISEDIWPDGIK